MLFFKAEFINNDEPMKEKQNWDISHPFQKVLHGRCGQLLSYPSHTKHNTHTCLTHLDSIAWNNNNTRRVLWLGHWSQLLRVRVYFWGRLSGNTSCELLLCMCTRKRAFIKTRGWYEGISLTGCKPSTAPAYTAVTRMDAGLETFHLSRCRI